MKTFFKQAIICGKYVAKQYPEDAKVVATGRYEKVYYPGEGVKVYGFEFAVSGRDKWGDYYEVVTATPITARLGLGLGAPIEDD